MPFAAAVFFFYVKLTAEERKNMTLSFTVTSRRIECQNADTVRLTADNSGDTASFAFDSEWDQLAVTARFSTQNSHTDVLIENGSCPIPVISDGGWVDVGVFGGNIRSTNNIRLRCTESVLTRDSAPANPTPDVYSQIISLLGRGTITSAVINASGELIISFGDGTSVNAGTAAGASGNPGMSAFELAVEQGFMGTEAQWLTSLEGANGADGATGADGETPTIGANGNWYIGTTDTGVSASGYCSAVEDEAVGINSTQWMRRVYYNIVDPGTSTNSYWYSDNHAKQLSGGNKYITDYIAVTAGTSYVCKSVRTLKFFDSTQIYLGSATGVIALNNVTATVTVPDSAYYMKAQMDDTLYSTASQIYESGYGDFDYDTFENLYAIAITDPTYATMIVSALTGKIADGSVHLSDYIADGEFSAKALDFLSEFHINLFNADTIIETFKINTSTGDEQSNTNSCCSDFIAVTEGTYISAASQVVAYDADKAFVSVITRDTGVYTLQIPSGVSYIRISATGTSLAVALESMQKGYFGKYDNYETQTMPVTADNLIPYSKYVPEFQNDDVKAHFAEHIGVYPFWKKKISFIGDSFTAGGTWAERACDLLHATFASNHAVSGAKFTYISGVNIATAYEQAQSIVSSGVTPDYVVIALGVNDSSNSMTLGSIVNSTSISDFDLTTFTGGVQACLNYLQNNFPAAGIAIGYTPASLQGVNYAADNVYIERIKVVAELYGVVYIDTKPCGMTILSSAYSSYYESASGGHPQTKGQYRIGSYMARQLFANFGVYDDYDYTT